MAGPALFIIIPGRGGPFVGFDQPSIAYLNYLNQIKYAEYPLELFLNGRHDPTEDEWRWGLRYYKELLRYAPETSLFYGDMGFCYYYLKDYPRALKAYQKAVSLEPRFYPHYWDLGMICFQLKRYKESIDYFTNALAVIPVTIQYYFKIGENITPAAKEDMAHL